VRRAVVSADSVAVVVVRAVVTVRVVTAAVMLARARRVVLPVTSLLSSVVDLAVAVALLLLLKRWMDGEKELGLETVGNGRLLPVLGRFSKVAHHCMIRHSFVLYTKSERPTSEHHLTPGTLRAEFGG
jgi:hypothetical protein